MLWCICIRVGRGVFLVAQEMHNGCVFPGLEFLHAGQ